MNSRAFYCCVYSTSAAAATTTTTTAVVVIVIVIVNVAVTIQNKTQNRFILFILKRKQTHAHIQQN